MVPLILIGALVLGAGMVFGFSSMSVGLLLMAVGLLGLITFLGSAGTHQRPGERETVIEERHYIGGQDDHSRYRT